MLTQFLVVLLTLQGEGLPEGKAVLEKTRQVYQGLKSYRFEHQVVIEGGKEKEKSAELGRVELVTICDGAEAEERPVLPTTLDRCRLEVRGGETAVVLVCGDQGTWLYSPIKKVYMKGKSVIDVTSSVSGSMLSGLHRQPFEILKPEAVREAKVSRREKMRLGKDERECWVVEGMLQPTPALDLEKIPPEKPGYMGVDSSLSTLAMHGLLKGDGAGMYSGGRMGGMKIQAGSRRRLRCGSTPRHQPCGECGSRRRCTSRRGRCS